MRDQILAELRTLEQREQVLVLYACESGSRAWGFPSQDSDYDVRFIYLHRPEWYLSIQDQRDVLEVPVHDLLDIDGWDLRKALKLLRKSNPPLLEWLQSPIVYVSQAEFTPQLRALAQESFAPRACLHHYLSIAQGNFREYLQGDQVRVKKYFYVLRPLLACQWLQDKETLPPMEFAKLVAACLPGGAVSDEILKLLQRKLQSEELAVEPRIGILNDYIKTELAKLTDYANLIGPVEPMEFAVFDRFFRTTLKMIWKIGEGSDPKCSMS